MTGEPRSNVRSIYASSWTRLGDELVYTVRGSGFLHHMVRNLVGTFLLAGKGNYRPPGFATNFSAPAIALRPALRSQPADCS